MVHLYDRPEPIHVDWFAFARLLRDQAPPSPWRDGRVGAEMTTNDGIFRPESTGFVRFQWVKRIIDDETPP